MTRATETEYAQIPTATAHELLASYWGDPEPRRRKPREFAFLCPTCGQAHVLVASMGLSPTVTTTPCRGRVRLTAGEPIVLPVALWRTHRQERMMAALYPALLRAGVDRSTAIRDAAAPPNGPAPPS